MNKFSPSISAQSVVDRLSRLVFEVLGDTIGGNNAPYALIDFPNHSNVGDSAIWSGERIAVTRIFGYDPIFVADLTIDWNRLKETPQSTQILLHGGGNFGDLWPHHQNLREEALARFPDRRIVQLPQSIHFASNSSLERCASVISKHDNFTLMVRDFPSLELARKNFDCISLLCPDSAFAMGSQQRTSPRDIDILWLLRTDIEARSTSHVESGLEFSPSFDWLDDEPDLYRNALRRTRFNSLRWPVPRREVRELMNFDALANNRVARGIVLLSRAEVIVTDRLHVHIIATLLGIPHVCLDNSYGKIKRFSDAFETQWSGVCFAQSLKEASDLATELLSAERAIH